MGSHLWVTLTSFPLLCLPEGVPQWTRQVVGGGETKGELCTSHSVTRQVNLCVCRFCCLEVMGRMSTCAWVTHDCRNTHRHYIIQLTSTKTAWPAVSALVAHVWPRQANRIVPGTHRQDGRLSIPAIQNGLGNSEAE